MRRVAIARTLGSLGVDSRSVHEGVRKTSGEEYIRALFFYEKNCAENLGGGSRSPLGQQRVKPTILIEGI